MGRRPQIEALVEIEDSRVLNAIHLGDDRIARIDHEELARYLGFRNKRYLVKLILHNQTEIERQGALLCQQRRRNRGRMYFLTMNQALTVCQLARTPHGRQARESV